MATFRRVHHVALTIPFGAEATARAFYGGVLGLPERPVPESLAGLDIVAWFAIGGDELHLIAEREPSNAGSRRHACFEVDDLAPLRQALEAAGYQPIDAAPIPGRPRFFCDDPFGNRLEFMVIEPIEAPV
ncbi:MAG: VOC family protein [Thermomicrobiaceae bacterium]|nr:VOC family protein [Thermomicrobiaceae bacterium]